MRRSLPEWWQETRSVKRIEDLPAIRRKPTAETRSTQRATLRSLRLSGEFPTAFQRTSAGCAAAGTAIWARFDLK